MGRSALRAVLGAAVVVGLLAPAGAARAQGYGNAPAAQSGGSAGAKQDEPPKKTWGKRREKKGFGKAQTVRERTGKRLMAARDLYQANQYAAAEEELGKLRLKSLNAYERASVHRMYGLIAAQDKRPDDARKHLQAAIAENALPPADQAGMRYQIAQLYLGEQKWQEAVDNLKQWIAESEEKTPDGYYLLALAYYQMENYDAALEPAEQSIKLSENPPENWLSLLLAIRLTRKEYKAAEPVMIELVKRYPKKVYWTQLSTLYGAQEDYDKALVYLELARLQGMLDQDEDVRRLAQLMLARDLPYPAAQLLEESFAKKQLREDANSFELLSTAWIQARDFDRALVPLQRAAELSPDGKLSVRLGQLYVQKEDWGKAEQALRTALDKGGLSSTADAQVLMGIVLFSSKRLDESLGWFAKARENPETSAEASAWIQHIEQTKAAALAAGG